MVILTGPTGAQKPWQDLNQHLGVGYTTPSVKTGVYVYQKASLEELVPKALQGTSMRIILLAASCAAIWLASRALRTQTRHSKHVIVSTDLSAGVIGPLGACQHCNPLLQYQGMDTGSSLIAYRPQDTDDAMAVIMALNHPDINTLSIIPQFGNTDLASEMFIAQYIVRHLKGNHKIPIVPGAVAPALPMLIQPPGLYFNSTTQGGSRELSGLDLFKLGCPNLGVQQMRSDLVKAIKRGTQAYIAVLGPTSDVACLLANHPETKPGIEAVVFLGSQPSDEPMTLNDGPAPPDFNVFMDPVAAAVLLWAAKGVQLVLMHWTLTSKGTTHGQNIVLNRDTIKPPAYAKPYPPASTHWLWGIQDVRTAAGFGSSQKSGLRKSNPGQTTLTAPEAVPPGPFDQYVIQYILDPTAFKCQQLPAYMQQCPSAPWLKNSSEPYNDESNSCPGHGPGTMLRNREQPAMMLVDLSDRPNRSGQRVLFLNRRYSGPLVAGEGLLPSFNSEAARRVTVCYDYAKGGWQKFVDSLSRWIW